MSLVAPVKNGQVQETGTTAKSKQEIKTENGGLDKEAFLSLLVAEMQNQDPLEPTTNTEYISQLATFSSLEEMQNMAQSYEVSRSVELVGKEVYLKSTNATTGATNYVHGIVDYVQMSGKDALLSVNGQLYSIDELDSVYDQTYSTAYNMAYNWSVDLNKLPALSKVTLADRSDIEALRETYDKMDDYQKSFVASDNVDRLKKYEEQLEALKTAANNNNSSNNSSSSSSNNSTTTDSTGNSSNAESTTNNSNTTATENVSNSDNTASESNSSDNTSSTEAVAASTTVAKESDDSSDELTDEELEALTNG